MATRKPAKRQEPTMPSMDDIARVFLNKPPEPHLQPKPAKQAPKKANKPA